LVAFARQWQACHHGRSCDGDPGGKAAADTPSLRRVIGNKIATYLRHECNRGAITKTGTSRDAAWSVTA
jgi:hypothetical protein